MINGSRPCPLPVSDTWRNSEDYVEALLTFITTSNLFKNLCGGIHVLDFLTREPDLYTWILPEDWRTWFDVVDVYDLLDLLLRDDLCQFNRQDHNAHENTFQQWKGKPLPPASLITYIRTVRSLCLERSFTAAKPEVESIPRHVAVGMKDKKLHEVMNFASFVQGLSDQLADESNRTTPTVVDFGSGQNYLGRTLACPPYDMDVIAIEQRHHNVDGAKAMDVQAKLAKKEKIMRNKKEYKRRLAELQTESEDFCTLQTSSNPQSVPATENEYYPHLPPKGSVTYVERELHDGHIEEVLHTQDEIDRDQNSSASNSLVVSIHSCGNLTHHGLRSLTLNPSVKAVAVVGCCYNLLTERLGPATYKLPQLRPNHPRLEETGSTYDPHGFPMSKRFETFKYTVDSDPAMRYSMGTKPNNEQANGSIKLEQGVRLNITARMMAVQAPQNWTRSESESFFTRHFFRALLQRIFLDLGVVQMATLTSSDTDSPISNDGASISGRDAAGTPLIIGSLRKSCFESFPAYVAGALEKLYKDEQDGERIRSLTHDLATDVDVAVGYERRFAYAKKHLSVIWCLMAFSAGVVESAIVVDRWLWLKEQDEVRDAWVQTVFDYKQSPRNLVVVGIKK